MILYKSKDYMMLLILLVFSTMSFCGCSQVVEDTHRETILYEISDDQIEIGKCINEKNGEEYDFESYRALHDYYELENNKVYVVTLENRGVQSTSIMA